MANMLMAFVAMAYVAIADIVSARIVRAGNRFDLHAHGQDIDMVPFRPPSVHSYGFLQVAFSYGSLQVAFSV